MRERKRVKVNSQTLNYVLSIQFDFVRVNPLEKRCRIERILIHSMIIVKTIKFSFSFHTTYFNLNLRFSFHQWFYVHVSIRIYRSTFELNRMWGINGWIQLINECHRWLIEQLLNLGEIYVHRVAQGNIRESKIFDHPNESNVPLTQNKLNIQ